MNLPGNAGSGDQIYTYDRAGRLTSWDDSGDPATVDTCGEGTPSGEIYTYDNRGNRLTAGAESFSYDDRNRLTSDPEGTYTWSPAGAMETFTPTNGDPVETFERDAAHRLAAVTQGSDEVTYNYDSFDRITTRNDTEPFTYTGGDMDPTSDGTDTYARTMSDSLFAVIDSGSSGFQFPLTDLHGDIVGLIDPDGTLAGSTSFEPYGEPTDTVGDTTRLGFQGDRTEPDNGRVWMGARWYQPSSATFLTRDTYTGELSTPFSLNRYTYALNNPTRYWDPTGHRPEPLNIVEEAIDVVSSWFFPRPRSRQVSCLKCGRQYQPPRSSKARPAVPQPAPWLSGSSSTASSGGAHPNPGQRSSHIW